MLSGRKMNPSLRRHYTGHLKVGAMVVGPRIHGSVQQRQKSGPKTTAGRYTIPKLAKDRQWWKTFVAALHTSGYNGQ